MLFGDLTNVSRRFFVTDDAKVIRQCAIIHKYLDRLLTLTYELWLGGIEPEKAGITLE